MRQSVTNFFLLLPLCLSITLAACKDDDNGGAANIDTSSAVTPQTVEEAEQQYSGFTPALSGGLDTIGNALGSIDAAPAANMAPALSAAPANVQTIFNKLAALQTQADANGEVTVDCNGGGSVTVKVLAQDNSNESIDIEYSVVFNNCITEEGEFVTTNDGKINVDFSTSLAALENETDGDLTYGASFNFVSTVKQGGTVTNHAEFDIDFNYVITDSELSIEADGAMSIENADYPCYSGTYVVDTISPMVLSFEGDDSCPASGSIKVNGVTYEFDGNSVQISGNGIDETVACGDIEATQCTE